MPGSSLRLLQRRRGFEDKEPAPDSRLRGAWRTL
jgi:hypothetical protein